MSRELYSKKISFYSANVSINIENIENCKLVVSTTFGSST